MICQNILKLKMYHIHSQTTAASSSSRSGFIERDDTTGELTVGNGNQATPLAGHKRAFIIFVSAPSFRTSLGEWHMGSLCQFINQISSRSAQFL